MPLAKFVDKIFDIFLPKKTSKGVRQFLSYLICGGFATLSDMIVLDHLIAAAFGFLTGVITNYTLNIMLVFKSQGKVKKEFTLFAVIGIGGLLWTELILWILVDNLGLYLMVAKMIAVIIVLNWNFFMRKKFVFPSDSNIENIEKSLQ